MKTRKTYGNYGSPDHFYVDDKEVSQAEYEAAHTPKEIGCPETGNWTTPVLSDAMAVHPKQIKDAMDRDKKAGVPTEYAPDGRPIVRSGDHQRRLAKSLGMHLNNSFL